MFLDFLYMSSIIGPIFIEPIVIIVMLATGDLTWGGDDLTEEQIIERERRANSSDAQEEASEDGFINFKERGRTRYSADDH